MCDFVIFGLLDFVFVGFCCILDFGFLDFVGFWSLESGLFGEIAR